MSPKTLDYHHGKHHKAYVDKTNVMVGVKGLEGVSLIEVVRAAKEKGDKGLFNNSAQIWNHSFYWQCLAAPQGQRPTGRLAEMIDDAFGSTAQLLAKLQAAAVGHFSTGWAWLVIDRANLPTTSLHDADTPARYQGSQPLLKPDSRELA